MKKSMFYEIKDQQIVFTQSGNAKPVSSEAKVEVMTLPVMKSGKEEILNTVATAASSSLANGNEKVKVAVQVSFPDGDKEVILIDENPLVRNNMDYHEAVRHARNLQEALRKDLQ